MVICERYNFVYLRIPKNASSSLAQFFIQNFCDVNDKWTEVNDCGIPSHNVDPRLLKKYQLNYRFIHLTLDELFRNNVVGPSELASKRVISVIRDPLMRQLSLYFFLRRGREKSVSEFRYLFKEGRHESDPSNRILQTDYARVGGVDYGDWWLYNKLDRYVDAFAKQHNVLPQNDLQKFKSGFTPKDADLIDQYYDQKTMDAVKRYYEKDFEKIIELETGLQLS